MPGKQAAFWAAVAGVALLAQPLANVLADSKFGDAFPAFRTFNYAATRKNG